MKKTICNLCGKNFDFWDEQGNFSIYTCIGYGSKYDGEQLKLDLCCECMDNLIDLCVISPVSEHDAVLVRA